MTAQEVVEEEAGAQGGCHCFQIRHLIVESLQTKNIVLSGLDLAPPSLPGEGEGEEA